MKHLIFILFVILFSCEKDIDCYKCNVIRQNEIMQSVVNCGMNEYEIIDFRKGMESVTQNIYGNMVVIECNKIRR